MAITVSISQAKRKLGEIADLAIRGEQVVIIRKSKLLVLKELEIPEAVPILPPCPRLLLSATKAAPVNQRFPRGANALDFSIPF